MSSWMRIFLLTSFLLIGMGIGILITPEPPKGYEGFISVEACKVEVDKIYNTAQETARITKECIASLEECIALK